MSDLQAALIAARVLGAVLHLALTVVCGWWFSVAKAEHTVALALVGAFIFFVVSLVFWRAALERTLWEVPWPPESPWKDDPNETTIDN